MSRVGKMPVVVPTGVDVSVKEDQISVKGAGGALVLTVLSVSFIGDGLRDAFDPGAATGSKS